MISGFWSTLFCFVFFSRVVDCRCNYGWQPSNRYRQFSRVIEKRNNCSNQVLATSHQQTICNLVQTRSQTLCCSQAPVVQKADNSIHRINHYPVNSVLCFLVIYPMDSVLCYPPLEQPGPEELSYQPFYSLKFRISLHVYFVVDIRAGLFTIWKGKNRKLISWKWNVLQKFVWYYKKSKLNCGLPLK